jgi:CRISPR-associated protein Cmr5
MEGKMANENFITKLEKGRAESAYKFVEEAIKELKEKSKDYKSHVKKIPSMILSNGLGQTLAFVKAKSNSKSGDAYKLIYKQLTNYIKSECPSRIKMPQNENDLVKWVISLDSTRYSYVTEELLSFLNWLKRFSEGLIEDKKNTKGDENAETTK